MGQFLHELVQKVEAKEIVRTVEVEEEPRMKSVFVKVSKEEDRGKSLDGTQFNVESGTKRFRRIDGRTAKGEVVMDDPRQKDRRKDKGERDLKRVGEEWELEKTWSKRGKMPILGDVEKRYERPFWGVDTDSVWLQPTSMGVATRFAAV